MNVYLDYAATAPLKREVLGEMLPFLGSGFGNPDSLHSFGREAAYAVTSARDRVAKVLGVAPGEVYFTSGGTEADNWAVRNMGTGSALLSPIEHAAALAALPLRGRRKGGVSAVGRDGVVTAEALEGAFREDTGLVCVMAVNNETGCVQPVEELAALAHARGALFFSDCVQAAATQDLSEILRHADAISLSAHKLGGPKGVGALVVKKGIKLSPLIVGGEQERSLRGGTLNVAGVVGFAKALELAQEGREAFCAHTGRLGALFLKKLSALGEDAVQDGANPAENIIHLTFRKGGEAFLNLLDLHGIAASGGAACSAHAALPSHVMLAMGRTAEEAKRGVRFSFGMETTEEEVLFAAEKIISLAR